MSEISAQDLQNRAAEVLRRVEAGEEVDVLRDTRPVARITPVARRLEWLPANEIARELAWLSPDPVGLAGDPKEVLTGTTDDLRC